VGGLGWVARSSFFKMGDFFSSPTAGKSMKYQRADNISARWFIFNQVFPV
jgi:hypothetical protein